MLKLAVWPCTVSYTNTYGAMTDNALQRTNNYYIQITHTDVKLSIKILITAQSKSLITNTFYCKSVSPTLPVTGRVLGKAGRDQSRKAVVTPVLLYWKIWSRGFVYKCVLAY